MLMKSRLGKKKGKKNETNVPCLRNDNVVKWLVLVPESGQANTDDHFED